MSDTLVFQSIHSVRPNAPVILDVPSAVRDSLESIRPFLVDLPQGAPVAITAGSRGVDRMAEVLRECCLALREFGASPFIVPAMGSHGGATAEGQRRLLSHYKISEQEIGAPVVSSMETICVGHTASGVEVFMDRAAWESGRVFVLNRVKPHTDFDGEVESGLLKIIAVGLGKLQGATNFHRNSLRYGYESTIVEMARCVLGTGRILAGLGLVENDRHSLCELGAAPASDLEQLDRRLQARAQELYPKLPFSSLDLLIVDELGKNISGAGMDAKVIGRPVHPELALTNRERIRIRRIYVRDLTPESEGNAAGIGFADVMHERIARKIDFNALYTNARTGLAPIVARMPMHFPNDRSALELLSLTLGHQTLQEVRAAWIRNTLSIIAFRATPNCAAELNENPNYTIDACEAAEFDDEGNLKGLAPTM
jgi:hypothetical protein